MTQFNFKGDVDNISERQLEYINNVIIEYGLNNSKVTFAPVGIAGDNYVACVKRITIEGENQSLTIIAKIAPMNEVVRRAVNTATSFRNEHIMYIDILPKFLNLQKDADIPEEEQLKFVKCYGSFTEQPNEVILLEDLTLSGYIAMLDRFEPLSNECVKFVLKNFAIFHSMSYVLRHKEPDTYRAYMTSLTDIWLTRSDSKDMKMFFQDLETDTLAALEDADHINFVRHKIYGSLKMIQKLKKAEADSKYTVIAQGDSWTNNIMFKFEEGNLAESILIDYQLSCNNSPAYDILYLIFNCTDYETRRQHYYDWIDYYHSELEKYLSNFGLKANFVFPRDKLDADLKRYAKPVFGLCVCLASVSIRKTVDAAQLMEAMKIDDIKDAPDLSIASLDKESRNRFRTRVTHLIKSFTEFGLI